MSVAQLYQLEQQINSLPDYDKLYLIERAIHSLRISKPAEDEFDAELRAMAEDPEIQREIAAINAEDLP